MNVYTVHIEFRQRWKFTVRMNGGYTVARCDSVGDANKVAAALNAAEGNVC